MEKVAVNQFVTRQVKGSGKTYSESLSFKTIAADAEKQMTDGNFTEGYRKGVRIVIGSVHLITEFTCPFVKIDKNTELISKVVCRQEGEENYIQIRAKSGIPVKPDRIEYILYHHDVLSENNEESTDKDWELISIHAIPKGVNKFLKNGTSHTPLTRLIEKLDNSQKAIKLIGINGEIIIYNKDDI